MIEKKSDKQKSEQKPRDDGVELENQFILRLPEEVAIHLHEALQTGNLKDRMTIKIDNELRYGEVCFDNWLLYARIVDLPTILECLKTIDNKNFYKSADICQLMICKEEPEDETEKESPNKGKKRDPNKVDRKYLWPHGVTPPCKNVRKRRFRKTLKKKNVEAPEIEKEVKRLFRVDNDAVKVEFEIIDEDVDKANPEQQSKEYNEMEDNDDTLNGDKTQNDNSSQKDINIETDEEDEASRAVTSAPLRVGEHDIFGEELSSSDEENDMRRLPELDEASRISADDSRMSSSFFMGNATVEQQDSQMDEGGATEFSQSMFKNFKEQNAQDSNPVKFEDSSSNMATPMQSANQMPYDEEYSSNDPSSGPMSSDQVNYKINELRRQFIEIKMQHAQKAQEISSIQNPTLKQRMQETLDNLLTQMMERELEIKDYENML